MAAYLPKEEARNNLNNYYAAIIFFMDSRVINQIARQHDPHNLLCGDEICEIYRAAAHDCGISEELVEELYEQEIKAKNIC
jgi:hypothetical protein